MVRIREFEKFGSKMAIYCNNMKRKGFRITANRFGGSGLWTVIATKEPV